MTREHGPRSAIARGALRPKSRFGGLLEPFVEGDATLYFRENRDLHTLSGFELAKSRRGLATDLTRYSGGSVLCELVMRLAPEHRDDRLYRALSDGLDRLVDAPSSAAGAVALAAIWRLVAVLGFAPDTERCLGCGRGIPDGEEAHLDFGSGGLRCLRCSSDGPRLTPGALACLRRLTVGRGEASIDGPQGRLLGDYIRYHLSEGARLKSLAFLAEF